MIKHTDKSKIVKSAANWLIKNYSKHIDEKDISAVVHALYSTDWLAESIEATSKTKRCPITCDQVSWLMDIFNRYLPRDSHPAVSRERTMKQYGMLYEVMEIAGLSFEDDVARYNGTPNEVRKYEGKAQLVQAEALNHFKRR